MGAVLGAVRCPAVPAPVRGELLEAPSPISLPIPPPFHACRHLQGVPPSSSPTPSAFPLSGCPPLPLFPPAPFFCSSLRFPPTPPQCGEKPQGFNIVVTIWGGGGRWTRSYVTADPPPPSSLPSEEPARGLYRAGMGLFAFFG